VNSTPVRAGFSVRSEESETSAASEPVTPGSVATAASIRSLSKSGVERPEAASTFNH
jgi:hypothetical protein